MNTSGDAGAFVTACLATDRRGFSRYLANRAVVRSDVVAVKAAKATYMTTPFLLGTGVHRVALEAVLGAQGPAAANLTVTVWPRVRRTTEGRRHILSWDACAEQFQRAALLIRAKGEGNAYNPTTNRDGHRCNDSTEAIHALVLDCDGTGGWNSLLAVLEEAGFAYLAHRSSSHTREKPKWRLIMPLASPFTTAEKTGVEAWMQAYALTRTAMGALACLTGPGFDPATNTPQHPWFPGYRRTPSSPVPEVRFRHGATLDFDALVARLPKPPTDSPVRRPSARRGRQGSAVPREPSAPQSVLERAFEAAGLGGRHLGEGKVAVRCPWNASHSEPLPPAAEPTSSTILFPASARWPWGAFYCSHASCGYKPADEVIAILRSTIPHIPHSPSPPRPPRPHLFVGYGRGTPRGVPRSTPGLRRIR